MAGSWPDMPSRKIAYHDDGTVVVGRHPTGGAPYENFYPWDADALEELNDLDFQQISDNWANGTFAAMTGNHSQNQQNKRTESAWIWPEKRDIYGYATIIEHTGSGIGGLGIHKAYTSVDTTNGIDGTWVEQGPSGGWSDDNLGSVNYPEAWRENQYTFTAEGTRSFRWHGWGGTFNDGDDEFRCMFIFGVISAGETPDRILFMDDSTGLEFTTPMDWGDVPRGSVLTWDIYLKNNSATLQANTMTLDVKTLYNSSDTWFDLSDAGGAYGDTVSITSMAAGARYPTGSDTITVRLTVPNDQPLGVYESFLELTAPASWS